MADVLVVGAGLIGTSIALALQASGEQEVLLTDQDPAVLALALGRGAGRAWDGEQTVRCAVVAVPPRAVAGRIAELQSRKIALTYTHVSSVQSHVQREVEALGCDLSSIVGGHPLAGRETSGPEGASADLFVGRPWALCPSVWSRWECQEAVRALALACGSVPVEVDAEEHDTAVALLSHLPQVVSSGLAGLLTHSRAGGREATNALSGPGLVDTTRLAGSDPTLWAEILTLNAKRVVPVVQALARSLEELAQALAGGPKADVRGEQAASAASLAAVQTFLELGRAGRALVPVKRGDASAAFARVQVSVRDEPGSLAALLVAAGEAGVNVEDVHVEHIPGRPTGVIDLLVRPDAASALGSVLRRQGWHVQSTE